MIYSSDIWNLGSNVTAGHSPNALVKMMSSGHYMCLMLILARSIWKKNISVLSIIMTDSSKS